MRVATELPNISTLRDLGSTALYLIATLKENDLAHGEFISWVESALNMNSREAQRFMKVAKELPNTTTWSHLGGRALYLISTLPEEERTKEHVTEKGETKTPDEMTVR